MFNLRNINNFCIYNKNQNFIKKDSINNTLKIQLEQELYKQELTNKNLIKQKTENIKKVLSEIKPKNNIIKEALKNNSKIEEKLNIIVVISNPCLFTRRYQLFREFIDRLEKYETNINIYVVELIYKDQQFMITETDNPNHLQLKTEIPLWHKENMINLAVEKLLPKDYKAFAWIDADIEFENVSWVDDTLKLLNGTFNIVQLFSHCVFMDKDGSTLNNFNSYGYIHINNIKEKTQNDYSSTGYAWAITKEAYKKLEKLYDKSILGGGDAIIICSILKNYKKLNCILKYFSKEFINSILEYNKNIDTKFGYIPGLIKHHYHGDRKNRKYLDRNLLYKKYNYNPNIHIKYNKDGIIILTDKIPEEFKKDILNYFQERNEDE